MTLSLGPNRTPGPDFGKGETLDIPLGSKIQPEYPNVDRLAPAEDYPDGVYPCLIRICCNQERDCCGRRETVSWVPRSRSGWPFLIPGKLYRPNPYSTLPRNTGWECRREVGFEEHGWDGLLAETICNK